MTPTDLAALLAAATPRPYASDLDVFDSDEGIQVCIASDGIDLLATIGTDIRTVPTTYKDGDPWTAELEAFKNAAWERAKAGRQLKDAAAIVATMNLADRLARLWIACERFVAAVSVRRADEEYDQMAEALEALRKAT